jgi:ABC-type phosphate/phosphonate transport system substrate-binding protein
LLVFTVVAAGWSAALAPAEDTPARTEPIRIGLIETLLRDTPAAVAQVIMEPFSALMESQTGIPGQLVIAGDAHDLAQRLKQDKFQLGVFHGVEFAWAQQEYPELKPLMLALNEHTELHAYLMVRNDSTATGLHDLQKKVLALPRASREHCHLFLERLCHQAGHEPKVFFGKIATPSGVEAALDDILRGKVDAAMVDCVGLECYKREKPGCFGRLRALKESEVFPPAVVAYYPGKLDEATLQRFREGMTQANQTAVGRQLLAACRLTGFAPVPDGYAKLLAEIMKAYPPPRRDVAPQARSPQAK